MSKHHKRYTLTSNTPEINFSVLFRKNMSILQIQLTAYPGSWGCGIIFFGENIFPSRAIFPKVNPTEPKVNSTLVNSTQPASGPAIHAGTHQHNASYHLPLPIHQHLSIMLDQFLFAVHWCHRWRSALCAFRLHQLAVTPDGAVLALQLKRTTPTNQMNHDDDGNTTMRGDGRWGHPHFVALSDPGAKETTGAHQIILRPLCIVQSTTGLTLNRIIQRLKCVELERAFIFQCRIGWYKLNMR